MARSKKATPRPGTPRATRSGGSSPKSKTKSKPKPKGRDYRAEYKRRIARGRARGFTPSQASGHPRGGGPGIAEIRQMRRAAQVPSPGTQKFQFGVRRPRSAYIRVEAQARIAEMSGVTLPRERNRLPSLGKTADRFVQEFLRLRLGTRHEAYTLWFSP